MAKTVALLRGVNVGGHTVKMDRLRALFGELGLAGVSTHIQSGNVLFYDPGGQAGGLRERLEAHLREALGFAVPAMLLGEGELEGVLAANPFACQVFGEGERVYITLLEREPSPEETARLAPDPQSPDEFRVAGRAAYVLCRQGYNDTAYSNAFFEKKLMMRTTTRNVETLSKLFELLKLLAQ